MKGRKATGLVRFFVDTALQNTLPKETQKKIEVKGRREKGRKKLPEDLKEKGEYSKFKEKALGCTLQRSGFGRCYGPVVGLNKKLIN